VSCPHAKARGRRRRPRADEKKAAANRGFLLSGRRRSDDADVRCLQALLALLDFEFDALVFLQRLESAALDVAEWAKRSAPPESWAMKPKPLASLNHFTVPV